MSRAGGASGRAASIVATMAVWLFASATCGRFGYTAIDPAIADGAGGSGMSGQDGANVTTGGVGGGTDATAGSGGTGGSGGSGGSVMPGADAGVDQTPDLLPDGPTPGTDAADACVSCPASSITLTNQTATPMRGTTGGGTEVVAACPMDQVVIGFEGFQGRNQNYPWLHAAGGICGTVSISGSAVTINEAGKLPVVGGTNGNAWTRRCPQNQVVIGFEGTNGSWMGVISFRCAPLMVTGTGALTLGSVTKLQEVGAPSGSPFPLTDCPAGQITRGQDIIASTWLDAFGLICAAPMRR